MHQTKRIKEQEDDPEEHDSGIGISHESYEGGGSPMSSTSEKSVEPEEDDDETVPAGQYVVEEIRDYFRDKNGELYQIKWKDYPEADNTWEPPASLVNCDKVKIAFYLKRVAEVRETSLEYIVTENGSKRRKGSKPKLMIPPDPRPLEPRADQFYNTTRYPTDEEIKKFEAIWKADLQKKLGKLKKLNVGSINRWRREQLDQALIDVSKGEPLTAGADAELRKQLFIHQRDDWRELATDELKDWEILLNEISEGKPLVKVENTVDWEGPPKEFTYINDYVPTHGIIIPDDPVVGCDCSDCFGERKKNCCAAQTGAQFAYTAHRKVNVPPGTPIYECNSKCKCGPECPNRVVQDGRVNTSHLRLCIFRTSNGRGWGVKTLKKIKKSTFVSPYLGEIITSEEAEKRGKDYDRNGCTYLFDLDINEGVEANRYTVDAAKYGNITHFINHSCDPNLLVYSVFVNCLDPNLPKLALFATRDIAAGEELSFDYEYTVTASEPIEEDKRLKQPCFCGSAKCRKSFF